MENLEYTISSRDVSALLNQNKYLTKWELLRKTVSGVQQEYENPYQEFDEVLKLAMLDYVAKDTGCTLTKKSVSKLNVRATFYTGLNGLVLPKVSQHHYDKIEDRTDWLIEILTDMYLEHESSGLVAYYERDPDAYANGEIEFEPGRVTLFLVNVQQYKAIYGMILNALDKFDDDVIKLSADPELPQIEFVPSVIKEQIVKLSALEESIREYERMKKEYDAFKDNLAELMVEEGEYNITLPNGTKFTAVKGIPASKKVVSTFDEEKFKEENPDIYNKYLYAKEVRSNGRKDYLKVTY